MGDRASKEASVAGDAARGDSESIDPAPSDDRIEDAIEPTADRRPQPTDSVAIDAPAGVATGESTVATGESNVATDESNVATGQDVAAGQDRDRAPSRAGAREIAAAICPYLASAGGSWRMATPSREHRCIGMSPAVPQSAEKQRRHCLSAAHVECGIYRAARDVRAATLAGGADPARIIAADAARRPVPRTAPILLEPPHLLDQAARLRLDRAPGQLALIALMVLAFAIVALSRISPSAAGGATSPAPTAFAVASAGQPAPSASLPIEPSVSPPIGSAPPSSTPSFRTTYTVQKGDSLNTVAKRFKTTVSAIQKLNGLKSGPLRIGQILKIP